MNTKIKDLLSLNHIESVPAVGFFQRANLEKLIYPIEEKGIQSALRAELGLEEVLISHN